MRLFLAALFMSSLLAFQVSAQELLDEYTAYIGPHDLYNSNGQRLTQPWQVLRQDRANFHRFGKRDSNDTSDSFFGSARNREIMERMVMHGRMSESAARSLVKGGSIVLVRVWRRADGEHFLTVGVY